MNIFLDIVFQSGEFYNEDSGSWWLDLLNTIIGVALGSIVTLLALLWSLSYDKKKEERKAKEFQLQKIKYLQSLLIKIEKDLKLQIDSYKKFSDSINTSPIDLPLLTEYPLNELKQIVHQLNQEDYYHSYLGVFGDRQEHINEFRNIISLLNFFDSTIFLNKSSIEKSVEYNFQRQMKFRDLSETLLEMAIQLGAKEGPSLMESFILETTQNYLSKDIPKPTIEYFNSSYLEVLLKGLINYREDFKQNFEFLNVLRGLRNTYADIKNQSEQIGNDFNSIHKTASENFHQFETDIVRIKSFPNV